MGKISGLKSILKKIHFFNIAKKMYRCLRAVAFMWSANYFMYMSFRELKVYYTQNKAKSHILILGHIVAVDKGSCNYLNRLASLLSEFKFLLLSETPHLSKNDVSKKIHFENIILPYVAYEGGYSKNITIPIPSKYKSYVKENAYLIDIVKNLYKCFSDIGEGYVEFLTLYYYKYFNAVLDLLSPEMVMIWNKFSAMHILMSELCFERGIQTVFMEFGVLPGTLSFDALGQMGESNTAIYYDEFKEMEVSIEEKNEAKKIWTFLKESKLNRNAQPEDVNINAIIKKLRPGRPTILYAGQNDYESGMYPYTEHAARYHSPIFQSSDEAAIYLAQIAKKNNWNLIYKPHPIMESLHNVADFDNDMIVVHRGNLNELIDISDLTITILSQTGYISMIREKATLMMGYTQLMGKNCTYEAFEYDKVERTIEKALLNELTDDMKDNFNIHIAQLLKYYLFDDMCERKIRFGRSIHECVAYLKELIG